ncbi:uncharacterized protein DDB_G0284459-like [Siniperca chuatsi]|uniref:uncharacterized protein DDB_G0284459-like n=1 Tax=Siniperca chuatsi TaxID=119488 RepID=UPI001CE03CBB|nr:uncharacterized protein DDB_G0284459-like [Siniperca chuatsi]
MNQGFSGLEWDVKYPSRRQKTKCRNDAEVGAKQRSSPQKSVNVEEDPKKQTVVPATPATSATTVSAPTEAPKEKAKKASWWRRWLCRKKKTKQLTPVKEDVAEDANLPSSATEKTENTIKESEGGEAGVQEASPTPDTPVSAATELPEPENKDVAEDTNLPSSVTEKSENTIKESEGGEAGVQEASPTPDTPVSAATELPEPENKDVAEDTNLPSSVTEKSENTIKESEGGEAGVQEASPTPDTPVSAATELPEPENKDVAEDTNLPSSVTEKSENTIKESEGGEAGVEEASPTPDTPVSAATELPEPENKDVAEDTNLPSSVTEKSENTIKESEGGEAGVQEASPTPDTPVSAATELPEPENKDVAEDTNLPSSVTEKSENTIKESEGGEAGVQEASPTPDTPVSAATELPEPENKDVAEDTNLPSSVTEKRRITSVFPFITSENTIKESEGGEAGVEEASPTPDTPVSAATELPEPENKDVAEDTNLPSSVTEKSENPIKESEGGEAGVQEASPTPDTPDSAATETKKKKKPWWRRCLLSRRKKSPVETHKGAERSSPSETAEVHSDGKPTEVDPNSESTNSDSNVISDYLPIDVPKSSRQSTPTGHGGSLQAESVNISLWEKAFGHLTSASRESLSREELVCLGFPNLAQTCYMNSTLQGLLTLTHFIQEVHNQQQVWRSHPNLSSSGFVEVEVCRFSNSKAEKKSVLAAF